MEWIVNFCNRTPRFVLTDLMYCHLYIDVTVFAPLIMGQHILFFNKKSFKFWFILLDLVAKMSSSAKLKGLNLRYPTAWWDFLLRNTMSTGNPANNFTFPKRSPKTIKTFPCNVEMESFPDVHERSPITIPNGFWINFRERSQRVTEKPYENVPWWFPCNFKATFTGCYITTSGERSLVVSV